MARSEAARSGRDDFRAALERLQQRVETALRARLPAPTRPPERLHEAMAYATLGGGKRVRGVLVHAAGEAVGAPPERLDAPACAVEMIHAYSLVHDDMPCMDDDDLRRGKPTVHRAFDEATALLVGDALQTQAFLCLADDPQLSPAQRCAMMQALAQASGSLGMAGGQAIDLAAVGQRLDLCALETMHRMKTGALIRASVRLGALATPDPDPASLAALDRFAENIGLAFQVQDDILDVEGDTEVLGKTQGADQALNKPTYPSLLGMDAAKQRARQLVHDALEALESFGPQATLLGDIAGYVVSRSN
jgi:farnesyl diphosphate synthase